MQKLAEMFGTDTEKGLTAEQVAKHQQHYGLNKLPDPHKPTVWSMLWTQVCFFMLLGI